MSAEAAASPTKAKAKKAAKPKKLADHPKYAEMIVAAIAALKERTGSSRQAIIKYIIANYKVSDKAPVQVKTSLKKLLAAGKLNQVKGTGASGSFKLHKAPVEKKKKPAAKKPKAKKAKKPAKPKAAAKKKPAAAKKKAPAKKAAEKKTAEKKKVKSKGKKTAKKPSAKGKGAKKPIKSKKPAPKKGAKKASTKQRK